VVHGPDGSKDAVDVFPHAAVSEAVASTARRMADSAERRRWRRWITAEA
jgi:hypothetical protein